MERVTILADWAYCPRCRAELERGETAVSCPACGFTQFANPAPTASALVVDDDGRVLLARRAAEPGSGLWDLPGGFVEEGEELLDALRRELREEAGIEIEPLEFLGGYPDRYGGERGYTLNLYWTARIASGEPEAADDVAEFRWASPDRLPPADEFAFANTVRVLSDWRART